MRALNLIASIILAIGGLNWLSVGIFQFDIVASVFGGTGALISRIIYILVGVATLYLIYSAIAERGRINLNCCSNDRD